jgi:hypothetical protein
MFFRFEDVRDIKLLQFLVCKVDAQLFEGVYNKVFEPKYIQQTNCQCLGDIFVLTWNNCLVKFLHQPIK